MSHALLLRLFLSPSFFSVHVALQYLRIYADNIGITYYLTRRLRELNTQELREVWGFVCHLLVTRPTQSKALESFVVEICHKSTHVAMLTLWYMQAYLRDLSTQHSSNASFLICQRILHECHEIIFGDLPSAPYSSLCAPTHIGPSRKKVRAHVSPALVGIGMVLAGVPGMPQLTEIMGPVALEQGRVDEQGQDIKSIERGDNDRAMVRSISAASAAESGVDIEDDDSMDSPAPNADHNPEEPVDIAPSSQTVSAVSKRLSRRQTVGAQTSPALPLHLREARKPRLSEDPFGQEDTLPTRAATAATPFQSTPSFPSRHPYRPNSQPTADLLLQKYDFASQMYLLRSHYCRSEVQFILALENICNKLLVVPKPARVSALRAELTSLNHMLPAEICMPMWCSSSDEPKPPSSIPEPHHRIVRIPPGESVVLNSAERAPYLLLVEILHSDLDFDPAKRSNKEILKKIVVKENESKGTSKDLVKFARNDSTLSKSKPTVIIPDHVNGSEVALGTDGDDAGENASIPRSASPSSVVSPLEPPEEEEMDLVEQLYGNESSLKVNGIDISDSIVLPPAPKNKELDMATWSRASSNLNTPRFDKPDPFAAHILALGHNFPSPSSGYPPNGAITSDHSSTPARQLSQGQQRVLSLDEYSQRMRTAAVMLAQLNANLVPPAVPGLPTTPSDTSIISAPLRWLPGTSWLADAISNGNGQPSTPSGAQGDAAAAPTRMRLQASEAAAIRDRIMEEMLALEEERMARMRENGVNETSLRITPANGDMKTAEDEGIIRRELSKADPSAIVFSESWAAKKARVRQASPYGHLANWDCVSVIVKTGGDLRQEQLAVQLIQEFEKIWKEENCPCWVRYFRILITGNSSGLVETITDAVSIHSIKKAEYARRLAEGRLGHVSLLDHFKTTYGDPSSAKYVRAQRNFAKSLAGYSLVTYFLQIKDRHNGNILLDRDGHLIHIDFGFMLSNSPGNIGFEAAPFKLPLEYIEVLGGLDSPAYREFRKLFREGFDACRKHCDRIVTLVELMQKDSTLPCFAAFGEQTASQLRDRFQQGLTQSAVEEHVQRLIDTSLGSNWTRLYDSYQYYSQSIL
ncbi:kinase-like protein [Dichomitus squalens LYAD-421 SS1]|uniref:kinase-like protein n=1 Tax=Dichomitus squalens (strain LYAD-421) TaxID=732165 RepID=UPI0004412065|nr:kinase-like protein [Dichomitus squalens LYAD-421 SS1]EJF65958.1 kinase-like protein [Dichomitus squalens LYAD-421 SS1]